MSQCSNCGAGLRPDMTRCAKCGSFVEREPPPAPAVAPPPQVVYVMPRAEPRRPVVAFFLSFFIPGLGQLYNGQFAKAILFFIALGMWCMPPLGAVLHVVAAIEAMQTANRINRGAGVQS